MAMNGTHFIVFSSFSGIYSKQVSKRPPSTLVFQNVHVYYEQIHPNLLQSLSRLVMLAKLKCFVYVRCLVYNIRQGDMVVWNILDQIESKQ